MSGIAKSNRSVTPEVPWVLRPDIEWILDGSQWIAHDPLSRKTYRFGSDEKELLMALDGRSTLATILDRIASKNQRLLLELSQCNQLLAIVAQRGLLIYRGKAAVGLAKPVAKGWLLWLCELPWKLLFTRISLWNPDRWLCRNAPKTDLILSEAAIATWCGAFGVVLVAMMSRWSDWIAKLPSWDELAAPKTILGMGVVFIATRIIHELGHAFACTRAGARCVDTGLMMMMGVACPYVDVSDAWKIPNRWQRAWIAAAGMYAEMVTATIAGAMWFLSSPGAFHTVCWQITLVCTLSTLLFNANPLMRYDGYYLLCDLLNFPNLREVADRKVRELASNCFIVQNAKVRKPFRILRIREALVLAYGFASMFYRFFFMAGLSYAVVQLAEVWEVRWLGVAMVALVLISSFFIPGVRWLQSSFRMWRMREASRVRLTISWVGIFLLLLAIISIPLPQRIYLQGIVQPVIWTPVHAHATGTVLATNQWIAQENNESGDQLLQLANPEIAKQLLIAKQQKLHAQNELELARRLSFQSPTYLDQIPILESNFRLASSQYDNRKRELDELSVREQSNSEFVWAEIPGTLVSTRQDTAAHLTMKEAPKGMPVVRETQLGWLANKNRWLIKAPVSESQLEWLGEGMRANVRLEQRPWEILGGRVNGISFEAMGKEKEESETGRVASSNPQKRTIEGEADFEIQIGLDPYESRLLPNGKVELVVHSRGCSLGSLAVRWLQRNFR